MKILDRIYGSVTIKEKVLEDIIESQSIKRLGKINQYGAIYQIYPRFFTTRREHSIGVMLILNKLGASINEQIAGLIHDVPHTAFSHVIDYILGGENNSSSYHEDIQREILENSELPIILKKYGLDKDKIFEIDNFSLLERELPDLCADRIDYILRDLFTYEMITQQEISNTLNHLINYQGEMMFNDIDSAMLISNKVIDANRLIWSSPYQIYLAKKLADIIKIALDKKYISLSDLHCTDNKLFKKLSVINDNNIIDNLKMISDKIVVSLNENDYEMHVFTKLRVIDPKILIGNKTERLSSLNSTYKYTLDNYENIHSKGFKLNVRKRNDGEAIRLNDSKL